MKNRLIRWAFFAVALSFSTPAQAFNVFSLDGGRNIVKWTTTPVSYEVNATFVPYMTDDVAIINAAFNGWSAPQCSAFTSNFTGTTSAQSTSVIEGGTDGRNRVVFTPGGSWPVSLDGALAVTQSSYRGDQNGWRINEADIAFNGGVTWSSNPGRRDYDLQSVAAHEIGHLLGIQHSPNTSATMYFSTQPGSTIGASLHPDDEKAACFLYPQGGSYVCSTSADCPEVEGNNDRGQRVTYGQMGCEAGSCAFGVGNGGEGGQGDPCANSSSCDNDLICVTVGEDSFCTAECNVNQGGACPSGHVCAGLRGAQNGEGACIPGDDGQLGGYGDDCRSASDCVSDLCVSGSDDQVYCSEFCSIENQDCPQGSVCVALRGQEQGGCIFEGDGVPGEACGSLADCPGGLCLQGADRQYKCREACVFGELGCPDGMACMQTDIGDACLESGPGGLGVVCSQEWDCEDLLCLQGPNGQGTVCSRVCGDCPDGFECVATGDGFSACFSAADPDPSPDAQPGAVDPQPGVTPAPEAEPEAGGGNNGFVSGDGFVNTPPAAAAETGCRVPSGKESWPMAPLTILAFILFFRRRH